MSRFIEATTSSSGDNSSLSGLCMIFKEREQNLVINKVLAYSKQYVKSASKIEVMQRNYQQCNLTHCNVLSLAIAFTSKYPGEKMCLRAHNALVYGEHNSNPSISHSIP